MTAAAAARPRLTGRLTEPDEVAALVALLACGRARNMNGADLVVDGGQDKTA